MTWQPHLTVAVIVEREGTFLLVEEETISSHVDVYNQPAGHVECGETLIQAAIRETLEETGHHVEIDHLLGIYTYTPPMFPDRTYYRFCFLATPLSHDATRPLDTGIEQATWMTLEQLEELRAALNLPEGNYRLERR